MVVFSIVASLLVVALLLNTIRERRDVRRMMAELQAALEVTECAVIITDAQGTIIQANHVFEVFSGQERKEIQNRMTLRECIAPRYLDEVTENHRLLRHYPNSARRRYRARLRNRTGNTRE